MLNYFVRYYTSLRATNMWCLFMLSSSSLVMKLHTWFDCPWKLGDHAWVKSSDHRTESTSLGTSQMLLSENTRNGDQRHNTVSVTDPAAFSGTYHTQNSAYPIFHAAVSGRDTTIHICLHLLYNLSRQNALTNLENLSRPLGLMFPLFWKASLDFKFLLKRSASGFKIVFKIWYFRWMQDEALKQSKQKKFLVLSPIPVWVHLSKKKRDFFKGLFYSFFGPQNTSQSVVNISLEYET